ncbi:MAG TPA: hypothetical protein VJL29_00390 [Thermoguttaceae bacterium]|nr:hypothetical protein [Thermoguttaceae bacterium]
MSEATSTGFFTLGVSPEDYRLPHPRLGLPVILLIRRVLCRAIAILREQEFKLAEAREDEVTAALLAVLENNLRQNGSIAGFSRKTYDRVGRQGAVANFDGTRLAKSPDLCFKLRHDDCEPRMVVSEYDALFVECKPVDSTHFAGCDYCDDGLIRFVCGNYAWAMQEGMMLAYARDGRTIAGHLIPAMSEPERMTSLGTVQLPQACHTPDATEHPHVEPIHISKHGRDFSWLDHKGKATDITIYHLWHDCG